MVLVIKTFTHSVINYCNCISKGCIENCIDTIIRVYIQKESVSLIINFTAHVPVFCLKPRNVRTCYSVKPFEKVEKVVA